MARVRLGMALQDLRGGVGQDVMFRTRAGLAVRKKARFRWKPDAAYQAQAQRLSLANSIWSTFTAQQAQDWSAYANTIRKVEPVTLTEYSPTGKNAFVGLTTKFLQVNPVGEVPVVPPSSEFLGDTVALDFEATSSGVRITSSKANDAGVITELLLQVLPNVRRKPTKFYKSAAFHTFTAIGSSYDLDLPPGVYAFAYRFIREASGQSTYQMPVDGIFEVGG